MLRATVMGKQRIAILGGGMAALTAAFEITNTANWQDEFDVTVYQLGWRLGGKGASGRNAEHSQRIEEHGLHILLGFYENAFRVLKACYDELGRPKNAPLATWQDAFKPHDYVVLMEKVGDHYEPWAMSFPPNSDEPGTGGVLPTPLAMIEMMLGWLAQLFIQSPRLPDHDPRLGAAKAAAKVGDHQTLHEKLRELQLLLHGIAFVESPDKSSDWRRMFVTVDLGLAALIGMIEDGVIYPPFDFFKLDTLDFRAWLEKYDAWDISVNSAYITGMYDLGFSLPGQVGAGTALNGILRMCWTYKGAVMWKMQAGMGDTIFGPLYLVLKQRGVRFEFFQRVDNLALSDDKTRIAAVTIGQQVTVKGEYDPLVEVNGLPCWPSKPRYDQLVQGQELEASGCDLEDWWTKWQDPVPPRVLRDGVDYDQLILGCSVGVFPYIAKELIAASPPFRTMVEAIGTTQTQALQLWMSTDLAGLGWTLPSPVLDGYAEPMDTWADMTHLLPREQWPATDLPKNLAYLCSPLPDNGPLPPRTDHGYAQRQAARVYEDSLDWLNHSAAGLWPKATGPGGAGFDYSLLVAPGSTATGQDRLKTQYWLATLNPSDRYVLALPNTVDKRLHTDGAGFLNLLLAGDYLRTGMNVGCVEAATMGGMHASRAICGRPSEIVGERPDYIRRGGDLVMAQPLALSGATMYSFLVDADPVALSRMIDTQLNAVSAASGTIYKPLCGMAAIVCADITKSFSQTPPDAEKGWMSERDFGVWIPVVAGSGTPWKPDRIGWYLPYVFVDNVAALVTGREVYGFFKQTATLAMPPKPGAPGLFSIDALVIPKYSPRSQAENLRLMTITATEQGGAPPSAWTDVRTAGEAILHEMERMFVRPGNTAGWWDLVKNLFEDLETGNVPLVFLKQFRDVVDPSKACYQAVIEAPSHLQKFYGGWFTPPHDIAITPCDSHPIVAECGLAGPSLRSNLGFWCQMDFVMEPGKVIAELR
jgi:uncharacterized protein with NAD-binding domain and iron-sulfur cluster